MQDELNLGWLDYGARMYQPDLGRFNKMDIFCEMVPFNGSYNYAENDPVNANDMGGNFKFPIEFRRSFPRVTAYLERVLPLLQNNATIVNSLNKHTNLGKNTIKSDFQNGKGPKLNVPTGQLSLQTPKWGKNDVIGRLDLNGEGMVQMMENGLATNDPNYKVFTEVYTFLTIVAILHEYSHEASKRTGYTLPRGWQIGEHDEGSNWEYEAFGRFIDFPTRKMANDISKYPEQAIHNNAESYRVDQPAFFEQIITGGSSGESQKNKPDADKKSSKRSGGGY